MHLYDAKAEGTFEKRKGAMGRGDKKITKGDYGQRAMHMCGNGNIIMKHFILYNEYLLIICCCFKHVILKVPEKRSLPRPFDPHSARTL